MTFGDDHPHLWLREHPNVSAPLKVTSSRGRRTVSIGTPTAKKGKSDISKKREALSRDSPAKASKKKKTAAARSGGSRRVVIQEATVQDPLLVEESVAQGVSTPVSKRPVRKTRAGRKTSTALAFLSLSVSVTARKSTRGIVYSERRVSLHFLFYLSIDMPFPWY